MHIFSSRRVGFIHVVEIVIITLVVFILVTQFSTLPVARGDWDEAKLNLQGYDLLYSADKTGVNWLDPEEVRGVLDPVLEGTTLRYSVTIKNALKANILVGCICTNPEFNTIEGILTPFTFNGEDINFSLAQIDPTVEDVSFPVYYDVIIVGNAVFDQMGGIGPYLVDVENYLAEGKGIVDIRDLDAQDFGVEDNRGFIQEYIFGLRWNEGLPDPNFNRINFAVPENSTYYKLYKYFTYIPSGINASGWDGFNNFLSGEKADKAADGIVEVILRQEGTNVPAMIVKEGIVAGAGKSAWLSGGDDTREERKALIRTLVTWMAGDEYPVVPGEVRDPTTFSIYRVVNIDMFQPIEVILSLGYIF